MKELLHKWRHTTQGLSDVERSALLKYFQGLRAAFGDAVPPEYALMYDDIDRQVARLANMGDTRKEKP